MNDRLNNDELIKQLRNCANSEPICKATCVCPYYDQTEEKTHDYRCVERMMERAANAIEELIAERDVFLTEMTREHNRAALLLWEKEHGMPPSAWIPDTHQS